MPIIPNDSLAVEGPVRAFNCVVVVPSMRGTFCVAVCCGVGGDGVHAANGVDVGGSMAVKKSAVGVTPGMFPPQPAQMIKTAIERKRFGCTIQLYPEMDC